MNITAITALQHITSFALDCFALVYVMDNGYIHVHEKLNNKSHDDELDSRASKLEDTGEKKLLGVDGYWYDITNYLHYHPGGKIIERFTGKDASAVFHAFHKPTILKHRKPAARMELNQNVDSALGKAFADLGTFFEKEGYFETNYYWYTRKVIVTFSMLAVSIALVCFARSWYRFLGAAALAAFWQQCGFFMHDAEHNQLTQNRTVDSWIGTFFATVCFGVSGSWWREEHFAHHALTACVHYNSKFFDPQMKEPVWAQNTKLYPFYQSAIEYYCIKIQHWTFLPICIFVGRVGIMIDSMKGEKRIRELAAFTLHCIWVMTLLSMLADWKEMAIFYAIAAFMQGILHIQLLISHYSKEFHHLEDVSTSINWYKMQVRSNIDIITPWWMDWFHGGLNFHLIHHLYPRMPRHNFRKATVFVRQVCETHNLHYDCCDWSTAVVRTLSHLKRMAKHFSLDPR